MTEHALQLLEVVREIERYAAADGWDRAPRLFALADTASLVAKEPTLAAALGAQDAPGITPVEQDALPVGRSLEDTLATIGWPPDVLGCALVVERVVLPPAAEAELADHGPDAAADHADREDVRMVVAVLRDGRRECALRLRHHDNEAEVLTGPDLVPGLADALLATLA